MPMPRISPGSNRPARSSESAVLEAAARLTRLATVRRRRIIRVSKEVIRTDKAGAPIGPYSQGIKAGGFVFVAGEKGIDPKTNKIVPGGTGPETRQTLENVKAILTAAGSSLDNAVATTVYLVDIGE